jgi:hypothetical protein
MSDSNFNVGQNPFQRLSDIFIENQRQFTVKTNDLRTRIRTLSKKLETLDKQLDNDVFTSNLTALINIEDESRLILSVAREVEFQREQVLKSVDLLTKSKEVKLNK